MNYREAMEYGQSVLSEAQVSDAKTDTWIILSMVCHINRTYYYTYMDTELTEEQEDEFRSVLRKRAERVPLQYITGEQEFMGMTFRVNPNVLIPRQDTETLVEEALKIVLPGMRILDLCTGSGCVLVSILKNAPGLKGMGCDISKQALVVAKENAREIGVEADFERSNLFENISGRFDVIVSNPPYIPSDVIPTLMPEVTQFEPLIALDGDADGLAFYRRITAEAPGFLNPGGYLMMEIGHDQGMDVSQMLKSAGFQNVRIVKDFAHNDRVVTGQL